MTELRTFHLPTMVTGLASDVALGEDMIRAWRSDGIFQIAITPEQQRVTDQAIASSKRFFSAPLDRKARHVSELNYSGYIATGEEVTAGEADYSEIFTVCKDLPLGDPRVAAGWPCHGPVPWPDVEYQRRMLAFMAELGVLGESLLRLTALGLGLPRIDALTDLTVDGWHHMRVLRFPARSATTSRGIGAHTDYGLLVIAAQDDVGGLYIRPPVAGEHRNRNWRPEESSAGMYENDEPWHFVRPVPGVLTVFPGDILQFLTGGLLLSTPHKVRMNTRERFAMAYFHEPSFTVRVRPLFEPASDESIHYGTHFTRMFVRCYPDRITTRRIVETGGLAKLAALRDPPGVEPYRAPLGGPGAVAARLAAGG
jgi:isopenicillin N synthase-like dioxygenase